MRYRDLETGTFLTRDPIGYGDGPNVYCYVSCNPITRFDPFGLYVKADNKDQADDFIKDYLKDLNTSYKFVSDKDGYVRIKNLSVSMNEETKNTDAF